MNKIDEKEIREQMEDHIMINKKVKKSIAKKDQKTLRKIDSKGADLGNSEKMEDEEDIKSADKAYGKYVKDGRNSYTAGKINRKYGVDEKRIREKQIRELIAKKNWKALRKIDIRGTDLHGEDFSNADVHDMDFSDTNVSHANFTNANARYANFTRADASDADFTGADAKTAFFIQTKLKGSDFSGSNIADAVFDASEEIRHGLILSEPMQGWMAMRRKGSFCELLIPKGAIVFSINNDICRTNVAKAIRIPNFHYKTGKTLHDENFCLLYNVEDGGIQFFRTKAAADLWATRASV